MKATIENSYTPYNEATKDYEDSQTRREWNPSSKNGIGIGINPIKYVFNERHA